MSMTEFIKKPGTIDEYTQEQVDEFERCAHDPVYFINNYCYIQHQKHGKIKFTLRPYQEKIIRSMHENRFVILLQPRQTGKTETTAAFAYWFSAFSDDKNVLVASNKQKGSTDIMNRIKFMYENTPNFLRPAVNFYNRGSIEFDNGSKIWSEATTETTGRGRSVALFISDELAFVPRRIQEEMWASILPTLSTGGSCVIMSTPNGDSDLFSKIWRQAVSGVGDDDEQFIPIEVTNGEVPGRDDKWQQGMINKLGELKFRQEYLNEFISNDPLLISSLSLQALRPKYPTEIDKGFHIWGEFKPQCTYIIGADVAEGLQGDFSTIEVIEMESMTQIAEFRSNKIKEDVLYAAIKYIIVKINQAKCPKTGKVPEIFWSFENNSCGGVLGVLYFQDDNFPDYATLISEKGAKAGFRTLNKSKLESARNLKNLVEKINGITINSEKLIFELKNYVASGASYAAKHGSTDDLIAAMLIVMRIMTTIAQYEPEVFNALYKSEEASMFGEEDEEYFDDPLPVVF